MIIVVFTSFSQIGLNWRTIDVWESGCGCTNTETLKGVSATEIII